MNDTMTKPRSREQIWADPDMSDYAKAHELEALHAWESAQPPAQPVLSDERRRQLEVLATEITAMRDALMALDKREKAMRVRVETESKNLQVLSAGADLDDEQAIKCLVFGRVRHELALTFVNNVGEQRTALINNLVGKLRALDGAIERTVGDAFWGTSLFAIQSGPVNTAGEALGMIAQLLADDFSGLKRKIGF